MTSASPTPPADADAPPADGDTPPADADAPDTPPAPPTVDEVATRLAELARLQHASKGHKTPWFDQELTFSQLRLLMVLREEGPIPMSRLAARLDVTPATATGVIGRIERRGLVLRRHRADDRRVVECVLTANGEGLLRDMSEARLEGMRSMLALLTPDELADFDRLIAVLLQRAGTDRAGTQRAGTNRARTNPGDEQE